MKTKQWILLTVLVVVVTFFFLALRPVPIPEEKDCLITTGRVVQVYESGTKDITIRLQNADETFYINRGLEAGLDMKKLRADLAYNVITIKYPDHWTPLDPSGSTRHVSKIELDGKTIFTELTR
jgi:hypothetical protein